MGEATVEPTNRENPQERYLRPIEDPEWIELTTFEAVREAFRSPSLDPDVEGDYHRIYSRGTLPKISGPEHLTRRRTWNNLVKRDGHAYFRDTALLPTVEVNIAELARVRDREGAVRFDVVTFGKRTMMQLGAALVGIDRARTRAGADELLELIPRFGKQEGKLAQIYGFDADTVIPRMLAAKEEYRAMFHQPGLDRRRALVARVDGGELDAAELPHDLLTLIAAHGEDAGWDEEIALRDSMLLVLTSADSNISIVTFTIDELRQWFDQHPEDYERRLDKAFLLAAVNESIRLHPLSFAFMRRAKEDVTLPGGIEIKAGQKVALRKGLANIDPAVFGVDAAVFNPYRAVPSGIQPYGLGFGAGPHMCFGIPILMGNEGIDGSLVHLLSSLYAAGLEPDPERDPVRSSAEQHGDRFMTYPVLLRSRSTRQ